MHEALPLLCNTSISGKSSSAITHRKKTRHREPQWRCKKSFRSQPEPSLKSLRSAKATWSECTNWCSIRLQTPSTFAIPPSPAADSLVGKKGIFDFKDAWREL